MTEDLIGKTLAQHYRFDKPLGEGTFARVYRVHDTRRSVDLAAKVLRTDISHEPSFMQRFKREGDVLARLQHPHIVRYYGLVEHENFTFILMEYVPGETLQRALYTLGRPLSVSETLTFLKPLTAALHFAHAEGVIHRDLKPANILLHEKGNLLVSDFGIARILDDAAMTLTQGDNALGTPLYMAPEQIIAEEIHATADVYALGVLLYQMLTGTVPFFGKSPQAQGNTISERIIYEHLYITPLPLHHYVKHIPEAVEEVVLRCLNKKTSSRFRTVRDVYDHLSEAVGADPLSLSVDDGQSSSVQGMAVPEITLPEISQFVSLSRESSVEIISPLPVGAERTWVHVKYNLPPLQETLENQVSSATADTIKHRFVPLPSESTPAIPTLAHHLAYQSAISTSKPSIPARKKLLGIRRINVAAIALVGIVLVLLACLVLAIYVALSSNNSPEAQPTSLRPTITDSGDREIVSPFPIGDIPKTGNGEWVVYSTHQGDGHQSIQLVNIETSERRPLLLNQDMNLAGAAWSPDGERIAFYAYDETEQGDIYLMDADGDNFVNLTESPNYDDREPAWSPDGQQLVFHSNRPDQNGTGTQDYELYILDVNTLALKQITNNTVNDLAPDWSADGKYLVFYRYDGNQAAIYTMNIENNLFSQRRQISPDTLSNALYPTWSPDGQLVAFHVLDNDGNYQIYVMNADGTATRPLLEEYFNDKYPDWSPDGRYIIFQREIDGVTGIFVYSFITRQIEQVAVPNGDFQPDWQPHPIP